MVLCIHVELHVYCVLCIYVATVTTLVGISLYCSECRICILNSAYSSIEYRASLKVCTILYSALGSL